MANNNAKRSKSNKKQQQKKRRRSVSNVVRVNGARTVLGTTQAVFGTDFIFTGVGSCKAAKSCFCNKTSIQYQVPGDASTTAAYACLLVSPVNILTGSRLGYRTVASGITSWSSNFEEARFENVSINVRPINNLSERGGLLSISLVIFETAGDESRFSSITAMPTIQMMRQAVKFSSNDVSRAQRLNFRASPADGHFYTYQPLSKSRFGIIIRVDHEFTDSIARDNLALELKIRARLALRATCYSTCTTTTEDKIKSLAGPYKMAEETVAFYFTREEDPSHWRTCSAVRPIVCTSGDCTDIKTQKYVFDNEKVIDGDWQMV